MALSIDFLNTTYADLRGPLEVTFKRSLFLMDILNKKKQKARGGTLIERPISTAAPAAGVAIRSGDETLDMTRRTSYLKYQVDLHRMMVAINIPQRELDRQSGSLGVLKILQDYPQTTMEGIKQDFETFHLTGTSAGRVFSTDAMRGLMVLNGQYTSTVGGTGTLRGLLDFAAPSAQTGNVQNVDKSFANEIYNQYGDITSWASDGQETWRRVYRACTQRGDGTGPDVIITDDATFGNFQRSKNDLVRLTVIQDQQDKSGANPLMETFMNAKVYTSASMDLAQFTTPADAGAAFFLNTKFWEMHELIPFKLSPFQEMIANQDVITSRGKWEGQLLCMRFTAQGAVSGGAT